MSRSYKKAIIKGRPRNHKKSALYWRIIRSNISTIIRSCKNFEDLELPNPKNIYNDYDYCDYIMDYEYTIFSEKKSEQIKYRRK